MFTPTIIGQARRLGFSYPAEYNNFGRLHGPVNSSKELDHQPNELPQWINHNESAKIRLLDGRHRMVKDASAGSWSFAADGQPGRPPDFQLLFATVGRLISVKGHFVTSTSKMRYPFSLVEWTSRVRDHPWRRRKFDRPKRRSADGASHR